MNSKVRESFLSLKGNRKKKKKGTTLPFAIFDELTVETRRAINKVGLRDESYAWVPKTISFVTFQKVGVFSHTGSFSLKCRKWPYSTASTMGLSFRTLGLVLDSSGLGCEARYLGRLWVPELLENAFRACFGFRTVEKCMPNFVCYFLKAEIS